MRQVSDHDLSLRNDAVKSFLLILKFLRELQQNNAKFSSVMPDFKSLDVEKYVPDENHENLLLIFEPGSGGAKFSYREDKKFVIILLIEGVFNWKTEIQKNIAEWFLKKRSSFIHEFVHYLDIKEIKDLENFGGVDRNDLTSYSNNPIEIRGHLQQALHDLELDLEYKSGNRYKKIKSANTSESFVKLVKTLYFAHDFIKHLSKENEFKLNEILTEIYYTLNFKNDVASLTENIVLEIIEFLIESSQSRNK